MSLCLAPSSAFLLPRLIDDVFSEFDGIDRALRAHTRSDGAQMGQLDKVVDDDTKLAISLDVNRFKPEDLNVNLEGRVLTVEGKQEVNEEHGYSLRSFVRQWTLPKDVDVEKLQSSITEDGKLSIEAPKLAPQPAIGRGKSIPIQKAPSKEK
ncbi:unnamed protein product [Haemonchus placei]|uniref:SHSP domain-containing protein n=1 Tax=Haemonchus placei TaxID=6290 RepID=A0A0N4W958_HAEPC|nr:unnamed protein product [Haemonchus placei]